MLDTAHGTFLRDKRLGVRGRSLNLQWLLQACEECDD